MNQSQSEIKLNIILEPSVLSSLSYLPHILIVNYIPLIMIYTQISNINYLENFCKQSNNFVTNKNSLCQTNKR